MHREATWQKYYHTHSASCQQTVVWQQNPGVGQNGSMAWQATLASVRHWCRGEDTGGMCISMVLYYTSSRQHWPACDIREPAS